MSTTRRGFLGLLGAAAVAPLLVNATPVEAMPASARLNFPDFVAHDNGRMYRWIKADTDLRVGDIVCFEKGIPAGVAAGQIAAGTYGWMQVRGGTSVRFKVSAPAHRLHGLESDTTGKFVVPKGARRL